MLYLCATFSSFKKTESSNATAKIPGVKVHMPIQNQNAEYEEPNAKDYIPETEVP